MFHRFRPIVISALLATLSWSHSALAECLATEDGSGLQTQTLYAGQDIDAGSVTVQIVGTDLELSYNTTGDWQLDETHLWVGGDLTDMPQTRKGNPKVGNFPYASGDIAGATSFTFTIPLIDLDFTCPGPDQRLYVAAHAALQRPDGQGGYQTETGWANGDRVVERGNWATYFSIDLSCDCDTPPPPPSGDCETAFARSADASTCFLNIDEDGDQQGDFSRWGWSNGPLAGPGSYEFDIYAGAGQCNLNAATLVGTLGVDYDGSSALVTYNMAGGFTMDETHLYVGSEILARDVNGDFTVAPGQYPDIRDLSDATSDQYTVEGLSGDVYVVAHAVVCGEF